MSCIAFSDYTGHLAPMLRKKIGANIRAIRESRSPKLSLQALGRMVEPPTNYQTLEKIENGKQAISTEWIERIAKALNVEPVELVAPELVNRLREEQPRGLQAIHLDEQVATEAARSLATAALGDPDPSWGTVQAVALVLQELLVLFSVHPEAAADVRIARPALTLAGQRSVLEGR